MNKVIDLLVKLGFYIWFFIVTIPTVFIYIPITFIVRAFKTKILRIKIIDIYGSNEYKSKTKEYLMNNWVGNSNTAQNNRVFFYFLLPALGTFILVVISPFVMGVYYSMTDWNGLNTSTMQFTGLENYKGLLDDYAFIYSFYRTAIYSILNILIINVVAFSLAILVTQKLKLKNIYRAGFFMPNLIGGLVLGYIWRFIFNNAITQFGGVFSESILFDGDNALIGLMIVVTWQYAGYIMMIYIAAIQNIPQDLVEASKIDGANAFQRLRTITLPLVSQAFTVALFLTLVTSFKQFDTVMSLTKAGPTTFLPQWMTNIYGFSFAPDVQATKLIAIDIYKEAFTEYNFAQGQAKAMVFFIFLLIVSMVQVYFNKRREVEL